MDPFSVPRQSRVSIPALCAVCSIYPLSGIFQQQNPSRTLFGTSLAGASRITRSEARGSALADRAIGRPMSSGCRSQHRLRILAVSCPTPYLDPIRCNRLQMYSSTLQSAVLVSTTFVPRPASLNSSRRIRPILWNWPITGATVARFNRDGVVVCSPNPAAAMAGMPQYELPNDFPGSGLGFPSGSLV